MLLYYRRNDQNIVMDVIERIKAVLTLLEA